jgi:hypothetical protein
VPGRDWSDLIFIAFVALGACVFVVLMSYAFARHKKRLHAQWYSLARELGLAFRPTRYTLGRAPGVGDLPVIDGDYRGRDVAISMEWARRDSSTPRADLHLTTKSTKDTKKTS